MARPARKIARPRLIGILLALTLLSSVPSASAAPGSYAPFSATGSVIANHDGDTFKLQTQDHGVLTVRFSGIDTPETAQAYWKSARRALWSLVDGKPTTVSCYKREWHGRDVCHVFVGKMDIGLEMVKLGFAWYAFQYAAELSPSARNAYEQAESDARDRRLGLWTEPDPMPPWECRRLRKAGQKCK